MAGTPINIVTAHTQVQLQAHTGTFSNAHTCSHTHIHTQTQMCHPYVHATCPFLTWDPDIFPDDLIHLASVHGRCKNIKPPCTIARYHQQTGRELVGRHIIINISVIYRHYFNILVCFQSSSTVYNESIHPNMHSSKSTVRHCIPLYSTFK